MSLFKNFGQAPVSFTSEETHIGCKCPICRDIDLARTERENHRKKLMNLANVAYALCSEDIIKDSEYKRLLDMINSPDEGNLVVAEEVINNLKNKL